VAFEYPKLGSAACFIDGKIIASGGRPDILEEKSI